MLDHTPRYRRTVSEGDPTIAFDSAAPINRRTVAKGIAWSVPAVAIAGVAPAFALSGPMPTAKVLGGGKIPGGSCKYRGGSIVDSNKFFGVNVTLANTDPTQVIYLFPSTIAFTLNPSDWSFQYTGPSTAIRLEPMGQAGSTATFWFGANGTNSGNFTAAVTFCIDWAHTQVLANDTHPHAPICSAPLSISFGTNHAICPLLFGQPA